MCAGSFECLARELDLDYLRTWAPKLGVADLLDRLLKLEPISSE
jgi:hypothetical protein